MDRILCIYKQAKDFSSDNERNRVRQREIFEQALFEVARPYFKSDKPRGYWRNVSRGSCRSCSCLSRTLACQQTDKALFSHVASYGEGQALCNDELFCYNLPRESAGSSAHM